MAGLDLLEAVVAGARGRGARVKVGVLVEGQNQGRVRVAKDVAALAAVVAAGEVAKGALAEGVVADGRFRVGLSMLVYCFSILHSEADIPSNACAWAAT